MSLNDLQLGTGDVLAVEALQEARQAHETACRRAEAEHVYDGAGRLVHPSPRWATATAYIGISEWSTLLEREAGLTIHWALGFAQEPRVIDTATIEWELDAKGPQIVHVGLEWRSQKFDRSFEHEIVFRAGGSDGRGRLFFDPLPGAEWNPGAVVEGISGILLMVRAL